MPEFTEALWGYSLSYPSDWVALNLIGAHGFAPGRDSRLAGPVDQQSAHLLIQGEWNGLRQAVKPLWEEHLARVAGMVGARHIGSAPWNMAGASGLEAEIQLPKKTAGRLWVGLLSMDVILLKLMVYHPLIDRKWFEPQVTETIRSLTFIERAADALTGRHDIPLPPGSQELPPEQVLSDLEDPGSWSAYASPADLGALQAFYYREPLARGWVIEEFLPIPGQHDLDFARLRLRKGQTIVGVGLIPSGEGRDSPQRRTLIAITANPGAWTA
jgi:hypothetical protein